MVKAHLEDPWSSQATGADCQSWQCTMSGLGGGVEGGGRTGGGVRGGGGVAEGHGDAGRRALWAGC